MGCRSLWRYLSGKGKLRVMRPWTALVIPLKRLAAHAATCLRRDLANRASRRELETRWRKGSLSHALFHHRHIRNCGAY